MGDDRRSRQAVLEGLTAWLDDRRVPSTHEVVGHVAPEAGYSSETLLVDVARTDDGRVHDERLVVKLPPAGPAIFDRYDFALQARVQGAAAAAGIPTAVPAVAEDDPGWMGAPFLVMPAVAGHVLGEAPVFDPVLAEADPGDNTAFHGRYLDLVADINRIDWRAAGLGEVVPRRDTAAEVAHWRRYLDWYADGEDLVPALTEALDWCEAHRPDQDPEPSLLWGDVRMGNLVVDDARTVRAVLDWEMASIGAAEHDLAWTLTLDATLTGLVHRTVPGFLDHDACVRRYQARLGRPVQDLAWYEVLAAVRSTAIMSRIGHLDQQRGRASMLPLDDNPILDMLRRRIDEASA